MSLKFAVRLFIGSLCATVVCAQLPAQESQGELQSILLADDLRPLIDLDSPATPESASKSPSIDVPGSAGPGLETGPKSSQPKTPKTSSPSSRPSPSQKSEFYDHIFDLGIAVVRTEDDLKIRGVFVDSPAQRAGLKSGDSISTIGGAPLSTLKQLSHLLAYQRALGEQFPITVVRQGQQRSFDVNMRPTVELDVDQTATSTGAVAKQPAQTVASSRAPQIRPQSVVRQRVPARRVSSQTQSNVSPNNPVPQSTQQGPRIVNSRIGTQQPIVTLPQPQPYVPPGLQTQRPIAGAQQPVRQPRVIRRYAPQQIVRGTVPGAGQQQQIQYARPQQYPQPAARGRGRIIGNGRVINSVLRAFGR